VFVVMTLLALAMAILFSFPAWLSVPVLLVIAYLQPVVLIAGVIYGHSRFRAFCIGGLVPTTPFFFVWIWFFLRIISLAMATGYATLAQALEEIATAARVFTLSQLVMALVAGLICLAVRGYLLRQPISRVDATMTDRP
jgi:hypothetical protein